MSSTAVDDTDPRFDYKDNAWTAGGQSGEYQSTSHSTSTAGAVVTFGPFTGTSIAVFSTVGKTQPKIHFAVDDGADNVVIPTISESSVQFQKQLYTATGLDPSAQHTLNINVLDSGPFTLDYLLISNGQVSALGSSAPTSSGSSVLTVGNPDPSSLVASSPITSVTETVGASTSSTTSFTSSIPNPGLSASQSSTPPGSSQSTPSTTILVPSIASASSSTLPSSGSMGAAGANGPDATVIAAVTGSIVFLAIIVVAVVLYLRRRRLMTQPGRSVPNNKFLSWHDSSSKNRPSLHLSIPSSLSIPRNLQRPSLLPIHQNKSVLNSKMHSASFGTSQPTPSFLAEDPNESPVFDIKQRPVSGSTMTTRVTVGTTIGQRVSVPDSAYRYPYSETPNLPPLPFVPSHPSPTETGASSATGSVSQMAFGVLGVNSAVTLDTSIFSGPSEKGTASAGSGASVARPLPYTPADAKRDHPDRETDGYASHSQFNLQSPRFLPVTPSEMDAVVHRDGGVRLASSAHGVARRELPPPYQDYGI